ncbi:MAG: hypothetical protein ACLR17_23600 [Enterobacteriaceae bacterium]
MVSFSNMDGAHCDSVVDHYTLPSNSIQMDVKVPVQPSNFDPLQKGALMGASTFMEQDKNHSNQCNYKTKSIPSPGTTIQRTQPMAGFLLSAAGLSIELRSIIRHTAAHPFGASATSALFNACGVSPSPGTTYSENPAYGWVFAFCDRTLHRTAFDYSPHGGSPFGASATSALFNACGVS